MYFYVKKKKEKEREIIKIYYKSSFLIKVHFTHGPIVNIRHSILVIFRMGIRLKIKVSEISTFTQVDTVH